ncbi:MAG: type II secretion system F family protein [Treponema sp.]
MKTDILLFTQTIHSLLSSCLPLQSSLAVCREILTEKSGKKFVSGILKKVSEGKKLSEALKEEKLFPPLYVSLVSIGEESGTLADVFGHLAFYLRDRKNMRQKTVQALLYPSLVLVTAAAVAVILAVFVMPHLELIFSAFANSSESTGMYQKKISSGWRTSAVILSSVTAAAVILPLVRSSGRKAALVIDTVILKIPFIKNLVMTMQMHDFSFAMMLLTRAHFPLVQSLEHAKEVLSNARLKKAVEGACKKTACGSPAGEAFESERIFPGYITVWIKIAEENGRTSESFSQIFSYYQSESEGMLSCIAQAAEPVFTIVTGLIIIAVIAQFVIPAFNLLGAL